MRIAYLILPAMLLASSCEASSKHDPKSGPTKTSPAKTAMAAPAKMPKGTALPPPEQDMAAPDPDSGEAAAEVLETYYALLADRKYTQAWALWGHQGSDSGMTVDAFAASFDKYASYQAELGAPGVVDAGMMQRWVEIPVTVKGKLKSGEDFRMDGPVILHHIAREMDDVPAADKEWRIKDSSGVKPRPN